MAVYLLTTAFGLGCAYFYRDGALARTPGGGPTREAAFNRFLVWGIFALFTAVSACRIAVGNDYWVYTHMFSLISQERVVSSELGFNLLVLFVQALVGKEGKYYLWIFGVLSLLTMWFFLKGIREQSDWFFASLFLFLTNGYYFSSFNSVRYYLALGVAVWGIRYVLRGEYDKFILWVLLAATFHKSVVLVIPVYLGAKWLAEKPFGRRQILVFAGLAVSLVLGKDLYRFLLFRFYPFYEDSMYDVVRYSWTNIGKCAGVLLLTGYSFLFSGTKKSEGIFGELRYRFYLYLSAGGLLVYTLGAFIPEVSRVAYYLVYPQIFLIPALLKNIRPGVWKVLAVVGVGVIFAAHFALFLNTAYRTDIRLLPYRSWIFQ